MSASNEINALTVEKQEVTCETRGDGECVSVGECVHGEAGSVRLSRRGLESLTNDFASKVFPERIGRPRRGGVLISREMGHAILVELQDKLASALPVGGAEPDVAELMQLVAQYGGEMHRRGARPNCTVVGEWDGKGSDDVMFRAIRALAARLTRSPRPDREPSDVNDSPTWASEATEALKARGFKRINDPRRPSPERGT